MTTIHEPRQLWTWADFKAQLPSLNRGQFLRLSDAERAPPYIRLTPKAPPMWDPEAIQAWIDNKMSVLNSGGGHVQAG